MARAEIAMEKLGCQHASQFIWERLHMSTEVKKKEGTGKRRLRM